MFSPLFIVQHVLHTSVLQIRSQREKHLCWKCSYEGDNTDLGQFLDFEMQEDLSHILPHISHVSEVLCLKWKKNGRLVLILNIQKIICLKNEVRSKGMNISFWSTTGSQMSLSSALACSLNYYISKNRSINHES